jgi:hypothetical protein
MTKAIVLAKTVSAGNLLADGTVTSAEITGLHAVATSGSYTDLSNRPTLNTTAITEGDNLYFTNSRARAAISVAGTGATYNSTTGVITFINGQVISNTTDVTEGTNLYYTNARVDTRIGQTSIDALADVDTTTVAPTNGQSLVWDSTTSKWKPATVLGGVSSFNTRTGAITLTSNDVTTALGFTPANASGSSGAILYTANTISSNITFTSNNNGITVGPLTVANGVTVTVPAGQRWVVV